MYLENMVLHLSKITPGSAVASCRIAEFMADYLNAPLYHRKEQFHSNPSVRCKNLFLVNSVGRFCNFHEFLQPLTEDAERIIWLNNDYSSHMTFNTQFRAGTIAKKKPVVCWTTIPDRVRGPYDHYVNWNVLSWRPLDLVQPTEDGLFYYGSFRENRIRAFQKYFADPLPYKLTVSAPRMVDKKFLELNPNIICVPAFSSIDEIQKYKMSIYIHDKRHDKEYGSPANRFYECVSAGVPMVFDSSTVATFKQAGFDVSSWSVDSKSDVSMALGRASEIQEQQRTFFSQFNLRDTLLPQLGQAMEKLQLSYDQGIEYRRPFGGIFLTREEWVANGSKGNAIDSNF